MFLHAIQLFTDSYALLGVIVYRATRRKHSSGTPKAQDAEYGNHRIWGTGVRLIGMWRSEGVARKNWK